MLCQHKQITIKIRCHSPFRLIYKIQQIYYQIQQQQQYQNINREPMLKKSPYKQQHLQQTTNAKTTVKNRDFSFSYSRVNQERSSIARALYQQQSSKQKSRYIVPEKLPNNQLASSNIFKQNIINRQRIEQIYEKLGNSSLNHQQFQLVNNEHRVQVEKLLLEISRLHDVIYELEISKKTDIKRLKQQYEHLAFLQLNNLKQSHESKYVLLDEQIKELKKKLEEKQEEVQQFSKKLAKSQKLYECQVQGLKADLKDVLSKKNNELFKLKQQNYNALAAFQKKSQHDIEEVKNICDKQMKKLTKEIENKQRSYTRIERNSQEASEQHKKIIGQIQQEKSMLQNKMHDIIIKNRSRYEELEATINGLMQGGSQQFGERQELQRDLYEVQIKNLMQIIKLKDEEFQKTQAYLEANAARSRIIESENDGLINSLKQLLYKQGTAHLREIQELKAKMAILHENDIKQLVSLYDTRMGNINSENQHLQDEIARVRKYMHEQTHRWYETKKQHQIKVSKLNIEIMRLRNGYGDLQKNLNERMQNQRSIMLLTSQNLIRDAQLKATNTKFYQDQLRKLRKLLDLQNQQHQKLQKQHKQAYHILQQQNKKLNQIIKQLQNEHHQMQAEYFQVLNQKQSEIKKLNNITHQILQKDVDIENQQVIQLKKYISKIQHQLNNNQEKLKDQNNKIYVLQRKILELKTENQQLFLENQINQEQAKSQYIKVVDQNLGTFKKFYERKIEQLQSDKQQLIKRNNADSENLVQLIRKYNQLQKNMKEMVRQAKKKTELERKIIELGLDQNLVANKARLFGSQQ